MRYAPFKPRIKALKEQCLARRVAFIPVRRREGTDDRRFAPTTVVSETRCDRAAVYRCAAAPCPEGQATDGTRMTALVHGSDDACSRRERNAAALEAASARAAAVRSAVHSIINSSVRCQSLAWLLAPSPTSGIWLLAPSPSSVVWLSDPGFSLLAFDSFLSALSCDICYRLSALGFILTFNQASNIGHQPPSLGF